MRNLMLCLIILLFIVIIAALSCAFGFKQAHARDNGQYSNIDPQIRAWVHALTDKAGVLCCDFADGYPAEAVWDTDTGKYRVRIEGCPDDGWCVVPDHAVIEKPNRLGYAVVWWYRDGDKPRIRCFLPGSGT